MMPKAKRTAVIIGAGPAGLTASLEFLRKTDVQPIVFEASHEIGGISRTIRYKGNRMDIGGHRFFSKSDRVMKWWMDLMPVEGSESSVEITYQGNNRSVELLDISQQEPPLRGMGPLQAKNSIQSTRTPEKEKRSVSRHGPILTNLESSESNDLVMLVRPRKSRIYYMRKFFDYPIKLSRSTIVNLGPARILKIGISYIKSRLNPIKTERSLQDFLINRFGRELYLTFFKSYTEKVWGTPCDKISAEWGAQRIKGLSLTTALKNLIQKTFLRKANRNEDLSQKGTDTSLIERFLYPKLGPGQLWEHVAPNLSLAS